MRSTIRIKRDGWPFNAAMVLEVPPGDEGVPHAIAAMREVVNDAQSSAVVANLAAALAQAHQNFPNYLYQFIVSKVKFRRDPRGVELLRTPEQIVENIARHGVHEGDCDEVSIFACAMLQARGEPCCFITMASQPGQRLHHVYYGVGRVNHETRGPRFDITPFNPQDRTPPGQWPAADRIIIYPC